jgi:hypothetical protein
MHQINVVTSLKVLPVWKVFEKIDCLLKAMSVRVRVFSLLSLYCSLSQYNFNVLHHFKYKFSSILFRGTIFLDSVVKIHFHLSVLMFSWQKPSVSHVHQFSR